MTRNLRTSLLIASTVIVACATTSEACYRRRACGCGTYGYAGYTYAGPTGYYGSGGGSGMAGGGYYGGGGRRPGREPARGWGVPAGRRRCGARAGRAGGGGPGP